MNNTYQEGDLVRVTMSFSDPVGGEAVDPDEVYGLYRNPSGVATVLQYGADPGLVRSDTGQYYFDIDASLPGRWVYRCYSTGVGQAAAQGWFRVEAALVRASEEPEE